MTEPDLRSPFWPLHFLLTFRKEKKKLDSCQLLTEVVSTERVNFLYVLSYGKSKNATLKKCRIF